MQHYSPATETWHHVADLLKKKSFRASDSPTHSGDETDYEREPTARNSKKRRGPAPKPAAKKHQATDAVVDPKDALERLSKGLIVRGGAYGLIGNSYLVTRAQQILVLDREDSPPRFGSLSRMMTLRPILSKANLEAEDSVEEGAQLVAALAEWLVIVERRGNGGMERGLAPNDGVWLCPSSQNPI